MKRHGCWIIPVENPDARLRLFCFPFAGGNASEYYRWARPLADDVELVALQLPGRGPLFNEPALHRMPTLTALATAELHPLMDKPFIFFGHSLGARIAFDLCLELRRQGRPLPLHFVASGSLPPQLNRLPPYLHKADYDDFIAELRVLGGTPEEILSNREMMNIFMPLIRADFEIFETYEPSSRDPLPLPLSIWGGITDPRIAIEVLLLWGELFSGKVTERFFPGGHMFISQGQSGAACLSALQAICREYLARRTVSSVLESAA